jgi:hypothetical protein
MNKTITEKNKNYTLSNNDIAFFVTFARPFGVVFNGADESYDTAEERAAALADYDNEENTDA